MIGLYLSPRNCWRRPTWKRLPNAEYLTLRVLVLRVSQSLSMGHPLPPPAIFWQISHSIYFSVVIIFQTWWSRRGISRLIQTSSCNLMRWTYYVFVTALTLTFWSLTSRLLSNMCIFRTMCSQLWCHVRDVMVLELVSYLESFDALDNYLECTYIAQCSIKSWRGRGIVGAGLHVVARRELPNEYRTWPAPWETILIHFWQILRFLWRLLGSTVELANQRSSEVPKEHINFTFLIAPYVSYLDDSWEINRFILWIEIALVAMFTRGCSVKLSLRCQFLCIYSSRMEYGANLRVWLPMEYEGMYGICTPLQNSGGRYVIGTNSFWNLWDQCGVRASVHWKLVQNLWKTTELGILICNSPCSRKLSEKSSKTEYMYPQFCISFSTIFRLETPPSNMTTKL